MSDQTNDTSAVALSRDDFKTDQDVRWCPGCGDYSILAAIQKVFPTLGIPRENFAIISGIGCSSRFPYYMNTYGFHSIHGRAPTIATGLKTVRPELSVWVITGDGDSLSIGGNHLIHILRRNVDVNILLFNNEIYGLTKGQYSPTSEVGKRTKSTPLGSLDEPFRTCSVALGAEATFIARTIDREPKHMAAMFARAEAHRGTSFVEIYQNCNIFNDGAFSHLTEKSEKKVQQLVLEHGKPLLFGQNGEKGIVFEGMSPKVVLVEDVGLEAIHVHDERGPVGYHAALTRMQAPDLPTPIGVLRAVERDAYDALLNNQVDRARAAAPAASLDSLLRGSTTWVVD